LEFDSSEKEQKIIEMSRKFKIVTPFTSLLVLSTVEQYIMYKIQPPESLPEILALYLSVIGEHESFMKQKKRKQNFKSFISLEKKIRLVARSTFES